MFIIILVLQWSIKKDNRIVLLYHHLVTQRTVILYSDTLLNKSNCSKSVLYFHIVVRQLIKINYHKSKSTSTLQIVKLKSAQRVIKQVEGSLKCEVSNKIWNRRTYPIFQNIQNIQKAIELRQISLKAIKTTFTSRLMWETNLKKKHKTCFRFDSVVFQIS